MYRLILRLAATIFLAGLGISLLFDPGTLSSKAVSASPLERDRASERDGSLGSRLLGSGPDWLQETEFSVNAVSDDQFGFSSAIDGDTAVISAWRDNIGQNVDQGSAFVFVRGEAGWNLQAQLIANDGAANDRFGNAVAIDGDTIVVGSGSDNVGPNLDQGSAYVFVRKGSTWTQQAQLLAPDGAESDTFGSSVAVSGDTIVVGSPFDDIGKNVNQGSAYVFSRDGTSWSFTTMLTESQGTAGRRFGQAVEIEANTIAVSISNATSGILGAVTVFTGSGSNWTQEGRLEPSDSPAGRDGFGSKIGIRGNTIVVGAFRASIGMNTLQGAAYVYSRESGVWAEQAKLTAADGAASDLFGYSVAIDGNSIAVGAFWGGTAPNSDSGAVYIFKRSGEIWTEQETLFPSTVVPGEHFGFSVAMSGNLLVVGASDTLNGIPGRGFVFRGPEVIQASPRTTFDFDGDGATDVSVFRPNAGSSSQWWLLRSSDSGTRGLQFGSSTDVPVVSDYTGDGKADIAFWRPSTGEWFILRSEDDSFFAFPLGSAGDIPAPGDFDGDGKADPAVYRPSSGTWFIVRSSDGGLSVVPFGVAVDKPIVADYDGDGKDDVGVYRAPDNQFWLLRSTAGVKAFQFGAPGDRTAIGDWTGDGKADVAFFRPATSEWYVIRSEDDSFFAFPWGASGDIPSPGDYDGDGKTDPAVWRPSDKTWYIFGTTSGFRAVLFGSDGDVPLPSSVSVN